MTRPISVLIHIIHAKHEYFRLLALIYPAIGDLLAAATEPARIWLLTQASHLSAAQRCSSTMRRQLQLHARLHTAAAARTMGIHPSQKVAGKPLKAELASAAAMAAAAKRFAAVGNVNGHSISQPDLWSLVRDAAAADTARARHFAIPFALPPPPPAPPAPANAKPQWLLRGEAPPGAMTPAVSGGFWASLANVRSEASWAAARTAAASAATASGNASKSRVQAQAQAEAQSDLVHLPETPAVAPAPSAELLSRYRVASMSQMFDLQETAAEDAQASIRAAAASRRAAPSSARPAVLLHARTADAHDNLLHPSVQPAVVVGTHPPLAAVGPLTGLAAAAAGVRRLHTSNSGLAASDVKNSSPAFSAAAGSAGRPQGVRFCEEQQDLEAEAEGGDGAHLSHRPAFAPTRWPAAADLGVSSGDEHYDWLASAHAALSETVGSGRHMVVHHDDDWGDLHLHGSSHHGRPHHHHHHHHGHHGYHRHVAAESHGHSHGLPHGSGASAVRRGEAGGASFPGGGAHRHLSTAAVLAVASGRHVPCARPALGRRYMSTVSRPGASSAASSGGRFAVDGPPAACAQQIAAVEGEEADADVVDVDQTSLSRRESVTQGYRAEQVEAASSELHCDESDAKAGADGAAAPQAHMTNAQRRAAAYASAMRARFGADGPPAPDVQALHAMAQQYDAMAIGKAEVEIARPPFREQAVPGRGDVGGLAVHLPGRTGPHRHRGHAIPPQQASFPAEPPAAQSALYNPVGRGSPAEPHPEALEQQPPAGGSEQAGRLGHPNSRKDDLWLWAEEDAVVAGQASTPYFGGATGVSPELRVTEHMPQGRVS